MDRYVSMGVAALALLLGMWTILSLNGIHARLDALEQRAVGSDLRAAAPVAPAVPGPPVTPAAPAAPRAKAPQVERLKAAVAEADIDLKEVDIKDPEVRMQIAEALRAEGERQSLAQQEQNRENKMAEIEAFAEIEGLDTRTVGRVLAALEERSDLFLDIREDVRSGALTRVEAVRELYAVREDSNAALVGILGMDRATALDRRLWGSDRGFGADR